MKVGKASYVEVVVEDEETVKERLHEVEKIEKDVIEHMDREFLNLEKKERKKFSSVSAAHFAKSCHIKSAQIAGLSDYVQKLEFKIRKDQLASSTKYANLAEYFASKENYSNGKDQSFREALTQLEKQDLIILAVTDSLQEKPVIKFNYEQKIKKQENEKEKPATVTYPCSSNVATRRVQ